MDKAGIAGQALAQLSGSWKCIKLYSTGHPRTHHAIDELQTTISNYLALSDRLVFDIEDGQVFHDRDLLVEESISCAELIQTIEIGGGNRLVFRPTPTHDELARLLTLLNDVGETAEPGERRLGDRLSSSGLAHVELKLMTRKPDHRAAPNLAEGGRDMHYRRYEQAIDGLSEAFEFVSGGKALRLSNIKKTAEWVAGAVMVDLERMVALTAVKNQTEYLGRHAMNVAILSTALGRAAGLDHRQLALLAGGALLHDIGKALIPNEVLNKPGALTTDEWALVARHPADGVRLLTELSKAHPAALIVAFEHHLGFDLSGYPTVTAARKLHLFSRIVQLADTYEGLTSNRAYRKANFPSEAIALMLGPMSHLFDPVLLRIFFRLMGVYPIGSLIRLSTGNVGFVTGVEAGNRLLPLVKLIDLPQPRVVRLADYPTVDIIEFVDPEAAGIDLIEIINVY